MGHGSEMLGLASATAAQRTIVGERPTGRLRWLRGTNTTTKPDVLQQEWVIVEHDARYVGDRGLRFEWRDVPTVVEVSE